MKKLSKVIGIISYLPDDVQKRKHRQNILTELVKTCNELFNLPIIIIAQNWDRNLFEDISNITVYQYSQPLTIVGARMELRKIFLTLNYDYLIMLDDDCKVTGTKEGAEKYLEQIDNNPDCWMEFSSSLLKLFAISKSVFKKVDYDNISLERREGFEDWVFYWKLKMLCPEARKRFSRSEFRLTESSINTNDINSTWNNQNVDNKELLKKTAEAIKKYDPNFNCFGVK